MPKRKEKYDPFREAVFQTCFEPFDGPLSAGDLADNKINAEKIYRRPLLYRQAVVRVAELVRQYYKELQQESDIERPLKPDLIIPVPNGANILAHGIGRLLGVEVLNLDKDLVDKSFSFRRNGGAIVSEAKEIVIVDDVLRRLKNVRKAYVLPGVEPRTTAAFGLVDRKPERVFLPDDPLASLPTRAVIAESIPEILPASSPYRAYLS